MLVKIVLETQELFHQ